MIRPIPPQARANLLDNVVREAEPQMVRRFVRGLHRAGLGGERVQEALVGRCQRFVESGRPEETSALLACGELLGDIGDPEALAPLIWLATEARAGDAQVDLWRCVERLALRHPRATEVGLLEGFADGDSRVRRNIAGVLRHTGSLGSVEALEEVGSAFFTPRELSDAISDAVAAIRERGGRDVTGAVSLAGGDGRLSKPTGEGGEVSSHGTKR